MSDEKKTDDAAGPSTQAIIVPRPGGVFIGPRGKDWRYKIVALDGESATCAREGKPGEMFVLTWTLAMDPASGWSYEPPPEPKEAKRGDPETCDCSVHRAMRKLVEASIEQIIAITSGALRDIIRRAKALYEDPNADPDRLRSCAAALHACRESLIELDPPDELVAAFKPLLDDATTVAIAIDVRTGVRACKAHPQSCPDPMGCVSKKMAEKVN